MYSERANLEPMPTPTVGTAESSDFIFATSSRLRLRAFVAASADFFSALWTSYRRRLYIYAMAFIVMSLLLFAVGEQELYQVGIKGWYSFVGWILAIDTFTSIADFTFLAAVDAVSKLELLRFYLDCFKGSFGLAGTIFFINFWLSDMAVPRAIPIWSEIMSACIIVVFLYIVRQFFQRRGYSVMTASRFGERLELMDAQHKILSILASWHPAKDVPVPDGSALVPGSVEGGNEIKVQRTRSQQSSIVGGRSRNNSSTSVTSPAVNENRHLHMNMDGTLGLGSSAVPVARNPHSIFRNLAHSYHLAATPDREDASVPEEKSESDVRTRASSTTGVPTLLSPRPATVLRNSEKANIDGCDDPERTAAIRTLMKGDFLKLFRDAVRRKKDAEFRAQANIFQDIVESFNNEDDQDDDHDANKSEAKALEFFWARINSATQSKIAIPTYNGSVTLRRRVEAKSFGEVLYRHLCRLCWPGSRGLTRELTDEMIRSYVVDTHEVSALLKASELLFRCEPSEPMTKNMVVQACVQVVRDHKHMAVAITDYLLLHNQVDVVADGVFWIVMLIIAQVTLQVDAFTVLAPLLTAIVFASFALGPTLSNLFLSLWFVLFMMPFDVGDRIAFRSGGEEIVGNVKNISLLTSIIITNKNEKIHVPNHTLFGERITNLRHSHEGVYAIPVSFALSGPGSAKIGLITKFWEEVKRYVLEEAKSDWKEILVTAHTIDYTRNNLGYSVWVTSRWSFAQVETICTARMRLIEKMVSIQQAMGITFTEAPRPIELPEGTLMNSRGGRLNDPVYDEGPQRPAGRGGIFDETKSNQ